MRQCARVAIKVHARRPTHALEILARVAEHPCVMRVLDEFDAPGCGYVVVSPLYEGAGEVPCEPVAQRAYVAQLLSVEAYCHARGVAHMDVRRPNVCFNAGQLVLLDFDNAELADADPASWWINSPQAQCTEFHPYAPPEFGTALVTNARAADAWLTGKLLESRFTCTGSDAAWTAFVQDAVSRLCVEDPSARMSASDLVVRWFPVETVCGAGSATQDSMEVCESGASRTVSRTGSPHYLAQAVHSLSPS